MISESAASSPTWSPSLSHRNLIQESFIIPPSKGNPIRKIPGFPKENKFSLKLRIVRLHLKYDCHGREFPLFLWVERWGNVSFIPFYFWFGWCGKKLAFSWKRGCSAAMFCRDERYGSSGTTQIVVNVASWVWFRWWSYWFYYIFGNRRSFFLQELKIVYGFYNVNRLVVSYHLLQISTILLRLQNLREIYKWTNHSLKSFPLYMTRISCLYDYRIYDRNWIDSKLIFKEYIETNLFPSSWEQIKSTTSTAKHSNSSSKHTFKNIPPTLLKALRIRH